MRRLFLLVATSVLIARSAFAGSVITTNLPASTAIINIAGTVDGTGSYSGTNQDFWYQPFSTAGAGSLLTYTIQPGTYSFTLTNPTLAATQFPALTAGQRSTMFTAWTYNSPWVTDYMVFDIAAATNSALPQLFSGANIPVAEYPGFASETDAFNRSQSEGWGNKIVNSPGGRYTGTVTTTRTFGTAQTLVFTVPDNALSDNQGGVSIVIAPATASGTPGDYNANGISMPATTPCGGSIEEPLSHFRTTPPAAPSARHNIQHGDQTTASRPAAVRRTL